MVAFPNAKINIGLNILRRRPDGYHDISTVMYPVEWCDVLEIMPSETTRLSTSGRVIDCIPEKNLVIKALHAVENYCRLNLDCDIYMHKTIPDGAGLGGGSSDAAFMVKLLDETFELELTETDMLKICSTIGADCPFFIKNTPVLATGIGEILTPIELDLTGWKILIVKPKESISTAQAYAGVTPTEPDFNLAQAIEKPVTEWENLIVNDFEPVVYKHHPEFLDIKEHLYRDGAVYASMSGSGSAFYGLFNPDADNVAELSSMYSSEGMIVYCGTLKK